MITEPVCPAPMTVDAPFRTSRHVRSSIAIGGIADIARAAHFGSYWTLNGPRIVWFRCKNQELRTARFQTKNGRSIHGEFRFGVYVSCRSLPRLHRLPEPTGLGRTRAIRRRRGR